MTQTLAPAPPTTTKPRKYNPYARRRCVRRVEETPAQQVIHVTKSFTNDNDKWHPVIDLGTGYVHCDCPHFQFRCARNNPSVLFPDDGCKHTKRAIEGCIRRGELVLPQATPKPQMTKEEVDRIRNDF